MKWELVCKIYITQRNSNRRRKQDADLWKISINAAMPERQKEEDRKVIINAAMPETQKEKDRNAKKRGEIYV